MKTRDKFIIWGVCCINAVLAGLVFGAICLNTGLAFLLTSIFCFALSVVFWINSRIDNSKDPIKILFTQYVMLIISAILSVVTFPYFTKISLFQTPWHFVLIIIFVLSILRLYFARNVFKKKLTEMNET